MHPKSTGEPRGLAELTGPFYNSPGLCNSLGITQQDLDQRAHQHAILALEAADGSLMYPGWQFTAAGAVIPHLPDVLRLLANGIEDPWTWAQWLCAPDEDLDGLTSWQWLAAGRDPEPVLLEAARDAANWRA